MLGLTASPAKRLLPEALIEQLASSSAAEIQRRYKDKPLLLVCLDKQAPQLLEGLEYSSGLPMGEGLANVTTMEYHTAATAVPTRFLNSVPPSQLRRQLRSRLQRGQYYAVPLCKRTAASDPFSLRISVGRATNKDIVLRCQGISKFHAWFQRDAEGSACVADAGSKNGTTVNSVFLEPRTLRWLKPMDTITFGSLECCFCPADVLAGIL